MSLSRQKVQVQAVVHERYMCIYSDDMCVFFSQCVCAYMYVCKEDVM